MLKKSDMMSADKKLVCRNLLETLIKVTKLYSHNCQETKLLVLCGGRKTRRFSRHSRCLDGKDDTC